MPLDPRGRIVPRATPAGVDAANANFTVRDGARHALGAMADNLEAGFISYKSWADATWEPPSRVEMLLGMMQRFQHDGSWGVVGFISYTSWAGAPWEPPSLFEVLLSMMQRVQHDGAWCFVGFISYKSWADATW